LQRLIPELASAMGEAVGHGSQARDSGPLNALKRAAAAASSIPVRFAAVMAALPPEVSPETSGVVGLSPDKSALDLLAWARRWPAELVLEEGASGLLELFERVQALHHPPRVEDLAVVWTAVADDAGERAGDRARVALQAARGVQADRLLSAGYRGPELGRRLREARLLSVEEALATRG
jgi:hypothetical protein